MCLCFDLCFFLFCTPPWGLLPLNLSLPPVKDMTVLLLLLVLWVGDKEVVSHNQYHDQHPKPVLRVSMTSAAGGKFRHCRRDSKYEAEHHSLHSCSKRGATDADREEAQVIIIDHILICSTSVYKQVCGLLEANANLARISLRLAANLNFCSTEGSCSKGSA